MLFCCYNTIVSIIKLKEEQVVSEMFKTVVELEEIIPEEDKYQMFGIFKKNPTFLRIYPVSNLDFRNF